MQVQLGAAIRIHNAVLCVGIYCTYYNTVRYISMEETIQSVCVCVCVCVYIYIYSFIH